MNQFMWKFIWNLLKVVVIIACLIGLIGFGTCGALLVGSSRSDLFTGAVLLAIAATFALIIGLIIKSMVARDKGVRRDEK